MSGKIETKTSFPVLNGYAPQEGGPKAVPITLDFNTETSYEFDLVDEVARDVIKFVQSVWVDNFDNPNALILSFSQTGQRLVVPAGAQGTWPVIAPLGLRCIATTSAGVGVICKLILLNVPMPQTQFGVNTINIAAVNATFIPTPVTMADASGTTTPATSTQLFAADATAKYRLVTNPPENAESIWINFQNTAAVNDQTSIEIPPGGKYETTNAIDQSKWNIYAVGAVTYSAKQGT